MGTNNSVDMELKTQKSTNSNESKKRSSSSLLAGYIVFIILSTIIIGVFSLVMSTVAHQRSAVYYSNYADTEKIYNGPLTQSAPTLERSTSTSSPYPTDKNDFIGTSPFANNAVLKATNAEVTINADFAKKGLSYFPTYNTSFSASYLLENKSDVESNVTFNFPFPISTNSQEVSNVKLLVNNELVPNIKSRYYVNISPTPRYYDDPYYLNGPVTSQEQGGIKWEGIVPANEEVVIQVSYDTVGLSMFSYSGVENPNGSQDFSFKATINGTRSYDVLGGLSVTRRSFGDNSVELIWEKPDLYSEPTIHISVADKLNPSLQVSRVYLTMAPIYFVFIIILTYLVYRFGKRQLSLFDMLLNAILFTVYFPLVHYLSSFTIDPTIEIFSNFKNVPTFSMPLYLAFLLAILLIGGLIYYLLGKIAGFRFSSKFGIPVMVLALGFFPLVVTIPEYSMLLVLLGVVALLSIIIQMRVRVLKEV